MKVLKRKEMPLFILMCESQTYRQFQDVFGKETVNEFFLHSFNEDEIELKFADIAHSLFDKSNNELNELIDYTEELLDMADRGKPLNSNSFLFQFFMPQIDDHKINWGLRGHPFLLAEIARKLSRVEIRALDEETFRELYFGAYKDLTGRELAAGDDFYLEKYDLQMGGISSGSINSDWFLSMYKIIFYRITNIDHSKESESSNDKKKDYKFILMDFYGTDLLYIEFIGGHCALFNPKDKKWINGGHDLSDARVGFDESEPEGSPYRFGNHDCMHQLTEISDEEAEKIVGSKINSIQIKNETFGD